MIARLDQRETNRMTASVQEPNVACAGAVARDHANGALTQEPCRRSLAS
jgi:hypothetical protein